MTEGHIEEPDRGWQVGLAVGGALAAVALGAGAVMQGVLWLWAPAVLSAGVAVLFVAYLVLKVPRLAFSAEGLTHDSGAQHRFWAWPDVGPFSLDVARGRGWRQTYVMCALTDEHHDLLLKNAGDATARIGTADIVVPLALLKCNRSEGAAQACVDRANDWREQYGAPAIEAPDDRAAAARLQRRIRWAQRRRVFTLAAVAAVVLLGFAALRLWQPGWF